jgi:hypothetical protein
MKRYNKRSIGQCHDLGGLPLFDWRQTPLRRSPTPAGAYVIRKLGVSAAIADVVASLAGLGPRERGR